MSHRETIYKHREKSYAFPVCFFKITLIYLHTYTCHSARGGQRTAYRSQLIPPTMWVSESQPRRLNSVHKAWQQVPLPLSHLANSRKSLLCEWTCVSTHVGLCTCITCFHVHTTVLSSPLPAFCANHRHESLCRAPETRLVI